ncbi:MAG: hypothetical protein LBG81_02325 [Coriobacteriaceae bacterium]|jgi:hypothetical protein|nr:hypothetical protein [Coriobacteriaceae bacterium]
MVVAIVLGVLSGFAGFAPLLLGTRLARRATATSALGEAGALLLGVLISFLLLAAILFLCVFLARDMVLPFALSLVGGLIASAIGYGVYRLVRK